MNDAGTLRADRLRATVASCALLAVAGGCLEFVPLTRGAADDAGVVPEADAGDGGDGGACTRAEDCVDGLGCVDGGCGPYADCHPDDAGRASCTCLPGFTWDGAVCVDIDECVAGRAECTFPGRCENLPGSWRCVCSDGLDCGTNGVCVLVAAGFACECARGYVRDGGACVDLDECGEADAGCGVNEVCVNTPGSHGCECARGYVRDGGACVDLDECRVSDAGCGANSVCVNTSGSHGCECAQGYVRDGGGCVVSERGAECRVRTSRYGEWLFLAYTGINLPPRTLFDIRYFDMPPSYLPSSGMARRYEDAGTTSFTASFALTPQPADAGQLSLRLSASIRLDAGVMHGTAPGDAGCSAPLVDIP